MVNIGYTDIVEQVLRRREKTNHKSKCLTKLNLIHQLIQSIRVRNVYKFQPNTIIALGGGSAMDAAKAIWMFFEHPETSFWGKTKVLRYS